jgi:hypothetical protein
MKVVYLLVQNGAGKDQKTYWNRAGVVFAPNRDGSENLRLDLFPGVTFQIREPKEQQTALSTPAGTATHKTIPHIEVVSAVIETLGFRHIAVVADEYAVSRDGMKMFGVLELDQTFTGCRFAIGLRNAHDKSMRLALTVGYRVFVCENMAFSGDFQPVLAKHSKNLNLIQEISFGIDQMQRNFRPMVEAVELWRGRQLTDERAKLLIYRAFVEGRLEVPRHLARSVHELYFNPTHEEFAPRTMWSLSNAFTSAFKELEPVPQFRATAKLAGFLEAGAQR